MHSIVDTEIEIGEASCIVKVVTTDETAMFLFTFADGIAELYETDIDNFDFSPKNGRKWSEMFGAARRKVLEDVDEIEDTRVPTNVTINFRT